MEKRIRRQPKIIWFIFLVVLGLASFFDFEPKWIKVMSWLGVVDSWIQEHAKYPGLFSIWLGLVLATAFVWSWPSVRRWIWESQYWEWTDEIDKLASERNMFWRSLRTTYANWKQKPHKFATIDDLINAAIFPGGLPLKRNIELTDFVDDTMESLTEPSSYLWEFAKKIYPSEITGKGHLRKSSLLKSQKLFNQFDDTR